ncbi:hypothetical protein EC968_004887 [Mortierella alpina]|nr:hypothetical protein EC968_004887 [Mortierella alpina]
MSTAPELSDLQLELLLTPSALDPKIPFLSYLPILQELLQLVQHLRQQCNAQVLAINPHIAPPSHFCTPPAGLKIDGKIERFLSLSMALAWRFCTVALVLLPQLPSFRASFHETVLRPFKREAAQYLARIQTYYKLGTLKYLEADLSSTFEDPRQQPQPHVLQMTNDRTEDKINERMHPLSPGNNELVQTASGRPAQMMAPAAVEQLHHQIDVSKPPRPGLCTSTSIAPVKDD